MTDYKQLCAELLQELESSHDDVGLINNRRISLINRTRAALAEPEPEGPTDKELADMYWQYYHWAPKRSNISAHAYALRAVLARWATPN